MLGFIKSVTRITFELKHLVGAARFELTTPTTPLWCATRLRYAPKVAKYTRKGTDWESQFASDKTGTHSLKNIELAVVNNHKQLRL